MPPRPPRTERKAPPKLPSSVAPAKVGRPDHLLSGPANRLPDKSR
jgi:hypothetical protein